MISAQAEEREETAPPEWFTTLVRTKASDRAVRVVASGPTNPIVIVGEPANEIAEAWQELYSLAVVWLALGVVVLGTLYLVLGRILDPLPKLARGMVRLEEGPYATRLETPRMKELAVLANRFNMLAAALEPTREENSNLYRRMITIQKEERREIASDLHDEAGPCLFGITANAASVKPMSKEIPDPPATQIRLRADEILGICERLKSMNRDLLKKLRPSSRGQVNIAAPIKELVVGFAGRHPDTEIAYVPGRLAKSYGEPLDLALYRCVQEGNTNAIRHGQAERVTVNLAEEPHLPAKGRKGRVLRLALRDNGRGMEPGRPRGFGLTVMNERVRAHGGACMIESERGKGTSIRIDIPLMRVEATRAAQLVGGMT